MNANTIVTEGWSNQKSRLLFAKGWRKERALKSQYMHGEQCGGCSFFAQFNQDWGLCCNPQSRHWLETTFEHFTCPSFVHEGWGPHSFSADPTYHCRCGGEPLPATPLQRRRS